MRIYFAHSYRHRGTDLEKGIIEMLSVHGEVVNPFEGEDVLEMEFRSSYYDLYKKEGLSRQLRSFAEKIVNKDTELLKSCDAIFAYVDQLQTGTITEIMMGIAYQKQIVVVSPQPNPFFISNVGVDWYESLDALYESKSLFASMIPSERVTRLIEFEECCLVCRFFEPKMRGSCCRKGIENTKSDERPPSDKVHPSDLESRRCQKFEPSFGEIIDNPM